MPKQDQFIFSERPFCGYGGGVGNGKSMSGIIKVYLHCMNNPGTFFLVGRRHATDLRNSTLKDWLQMMRGYGKWSAAINTFTFPNGSQVVFSHLDDLQSLTNMNLSGFWIDQAEEVPEEAFDYLVGRCRRRKGLTGAPITERPKIITFNPNGHDWIWRRFHKHIDADGKPLANVDDYELVMATTLENQDNLPEDYLKSILSAPEEWKKRFVEGSFDVYAGQIFHEFNKQIHVVPHDKQFAIPATWERFRAIDHGQNNPTACLFCAVDFDGNMWVYQEYSRPSDTVSNHIRYIKDKSLVPTTGGQMIPDDYTYTVIDPSTHAKTREKDGYRFSVADEYLEAGIPTVKGQNDVIAGINRMKEYLKVDPERFHPLNRDVEGEPLKGSPRLFIFARCDSLIAEMENYRWKQLKYGADSNNPEAPVKKDDHSVDALRYAIMSRPATPREAVSYDPRIWSNPLELARLASRQNKTVDDLRSERFRQTGTIRTSEAGISHGGSISHDDRL